MFQSGLIFDRGSGIFAAIIAIVGAYVSYAGNNGMDYLATNALFAITAAGTAAVASSAPRCDGRSCAQDGGSSATGDNPPHKEQPADPRGDDQDVGEARPSEVGAALEATARRLQVMAEVYDHFGPLRATPAR